MNDKFVMRLDASLNPNEVQEEYFYIGQLAVTDTSKFDLTARHFICHPEMWDQLVNEGYSTQFQLQESK